VVGGDASCFVEAAAALALGQTRSPRAVTVLPGVLSRSAFQDVIRAVPSKGWALPAMNGDAVGGSGLRDQRIDLFPSRCRGRPRPFGEGTLHVRAPASASKAGFATLTFVCAWRRPRRSPCSPTFAPCPASRWPARRAGWPGQAAHARGHQRVARKGQTEEKLRKLFQEVERLSGESTKLRERLESLEKQRQPSGQTVPPAAGPAAARLRAPSGHAPAAGTAASPSIRDGEGRTGSPICIDRQHPCRYRRATSARGSPSRARHPSEVTIKRPERAAVFDGKRGDQEIAHTEALAGSASCGHHASKRRQRSSVG